LLNNGLEPAAVEFRAPMVALFSVVSPAFPWKSGSGEASENMAGNGRFA